MTPIQLANMYRLHEWGHFAPDVQRANIADMRIDGPECKAAILSYQDWFEPTLSELTQLHHRRPAIVDGGYGPATEDLLAMPRCGHADILHGGIEQGNWPKQCRNEITTSYKMELRGLSPTRLAELWKESHAKWNSAIKVRLVHRADSCPNTRIYSFEAALGGSVLADQMLTQSSCGFRSRGRFDNRTWSDVLFVTTCTHEHGHALGAPHSRDRAATMYPAITQTSMARRGKPNESDLRITDSLGYERNTDGPPDPPTNVGVFNPVSFTLDLLPAVKTNAATSATHGSLEELANYRIRVGNVHAFELFVTDSDGAEGRNNSCDADLNSRHCQNHRCLSSSSSS